MTIATPPIVRLAERLLVDVELAVSKWPRAHRYLSGADLRRAAMRVAKRSLRDQCAAAGVPFLFKQWGAWIGGYHDLPDELQGRVNDGVGKFDMTTMGDGLPMYRFGKHNSGRLLDGVEWNQFPK